MAYMSEKGLVVGLVVEQRECVDQKPEERTHEPEPEQDKKTAPKRTAKVRKG